MQMISKLQDQMIAAKTEIAQLDRYTPDNPRIPVVRTEMATIQRQIDSELGKVAGSRQSLAASTVQYQRLFLESQFADKQLAAAFASLEEARSEASRKQAYVERIVQPNLPDAPIEPRRLRGIFATFALSLIAYGILRMLLAEGAGTCPASHDCAHYRNIAEIYAVEDQWRVIGALVMRELLTRYGRNNIGFLWLFVEPMLFTLAITAFWAATRSIHGSDDPDRAFALTGYSSVLSVAKPGQPRASTRSRPTRRFSIIARSRVIDVYLARIILEILAVSTSFVASDWHVHVRIG